MFTYDSRVKAPNFKNLKICEAEQILAYTGMIFLKKMILCTFYFSLRPFADSCSASRGNKWPPSQRTPGARSATGEQHSLALPGPGAAAAEAHAASSSHHPFALWSSRHSVVSRLGF